MSDATVHPFSLFYLAANPPHTAEPDLSAIAEILGESPAESSLRVRYPAAAIWRQSRDPEPLERIASALTEQGVRVTVLSATELFAVPAAQKATRLEIADTSLLCSTSCSTVSFALKMPLLLLEQRTKQFGAEYKKFKVKEQSRRTRKKRKAQNETHAFLATTAEEAMQTAIAKTGLTWILTQREGATVQRVALTPADLSFDILGEKKALSSAENIQLLRQLLHAACAKLTHQQGLIDLPYRYPMLVNPSFIEALNQAGFHRDAYPPNVMAERLGTAVWLSMDLG